MQALWYKVVQEREYIRVRGFHLVEFQASISRSCLTICQGDPQNRKIMMQNPSVDMQVAHENDIIRE